jgi:hypothetical protein
VLRRAKEVPARIGAGGQHYLDLRERCLAQLAIGKVLDGNPVQRFAKQLLAEPPGQHAQQLERELTLGRLVLLGPERRAGVPAQLRWRSWSWSLPSPRKSKKVGTSVGTGAVGTGNRMRTDLQRPELSGRAA